jgi:hypothetical protein
VAAPAAAKVEVCKPEDWEVKNNKQICEEILASLPREFYGSVELNFCKGQLVYCKTTTTRKFNPEPMTAGATNEHGAAN